MKTVDLKEFRKINFLNQSDVAKHLGISKSFISRVEKGREKLPEKQLQRLIENGMGWDVAPLLKEIDITPEPEEEDVFPVSLDERDVIVKELNRIIDEKNKIIDQLSEINAHLRQRIAKLEGEGGLSRTA